MKTFELENLSDLLSSFDQANMFNVYPDQTLDDPTYRTFNMNRAVVFNNLNKTPEIYFNKYTPREYDCWTLISYNLYSTIELWWLVCKVNGIIDPTVEPNTFTELKILRKEYVTSVLQSLRS